MKIKLHSGFKKAFKTRIALNKKLVLQTEERIALFQTNRENPMEVIFIDIGSHNQVY